mmetsp:Transcript_18996/g.26997  ORF Transcript_18996/g.26997 Transcript_18996/m.26997 type:complete len:562 (-) Transcript_18996:15-1700(-)
MTDHSTLKNRSFITLLNILRLQEAQVRISSVDPSATITTSSSSETMQCPYTEEDQLMQALSPSKNRHFSMNALYQAAATVKTPTSVESVSRCLTYAPIDNSSFIAVSGTSKTPPSCGDSANASTGPPPTTSEKDEASIPLDADNLRGITQKASGKWQAQVYYAGQSRYIGVFDSRERAALAYEMAREQLKADSCKNKVDLCVQAIPENTALGVVSMAKRKADILGHETMVVKKIKSSKELPESVSSTIEFKSPSPSSAERSESSSQSRKKTTPPSNAVFLQNLQEFSSVTECSSLLSRPLSTPSPSFNKVKSPSLKVPIGAVSSISSLCSNKSVATKSAALQKLTGGKCMPASTTWNPNGIPAGPSLIWIRNKNTVSNGGPLPRGKPNAAAVTFGSGFESISQINRVVSDDSNSGQDKCKPREASLGESDNQRSSIHAAALSKTSAINSVLKPLVQKKKDCNFVSPSVQASADEIAGTGILPRGITIRPSGKWQAQLYFAGKSRYIGVFDDRERAVLAYEIVREKIRDEPENKACSCPMLAKEIFDLARKAAFAGVQSISK